MKRKIALILVLLMLLSHGVIASADAESILGSVEGQHYINDFFGLEAVFPDDWYILSGKETAEYLEYPTEYGSREGLARLLEDQGSACALLATSMDGSNTNMNLMMENMGDYASLSEDAYYAMAASSLAPILEAQGYQNVTVAKQSFRLAEREHAGARITGQIGNNSMTMYMVLIKADQYMASLTITAASAEEANKILSFFQAEEAAAKADALGMLGETIGRHYENRTLGISLDLNSEWYIMSDEETAQAVGMLAENVTDESLAKALEENGSAFDLYAVKLDGSGDNITVLLENLGVLYGITMTEDRYYEISASQLTEGIEAMGANNVSVEKQTISFAGKEHTSGLLHGYF